MAVAWKEYQEEAATFFKSIGLEASTDVTVKGVRTSHDVDVLVTSQHVGFDITWVVECKHWKTRVSKLHVLALREIVSDVGADRGILLSESGFQSGAIEAANLTNVKVTSLADVSSTSANAFYAMRLRELYERIENCNDQYWNISKKKRIECGLRTHTFEVGYSGANTIDLCRDILSRAFRDFYPFRSESLTALITPGLPEKFYSPEQVASIVEPLILELEDKLRNCEASKKEI